MTLALGGQISSVYQTQPLDPDAMTMARTARTGATTPAAATTPTMTAAPERTPKARDMYFFLHRKLGFTKEAAAALVDQQGLDNKDELVELPNFMLSWFSKIRGPWKRIGRSRTRSTNQTQ
jgi:hypothetical protein